MRTIRITATLATGAMLVAGGLALATSGVPLVVALGVACTLVGAGYAYAGVYAETAMRTADSRARTEVATGAGQDGRSTSTSVDRRTPVSV